MYLVHVSISSSYQMDVPRGLQDVINEDLKQNMLFVSAYEISVIYWDFRLGSTS